eukprot:5737633-Prymnesium_polylepis.1
MQLASTECFGLRHAIDRPFQQLERRRRVEPGERGFVHDQPIRQRARKRLLVVRGLGIAQPAASAHLHVVESTLRLDVRAHALGLILKRDVAKSLDIGLRVSLRLVVLVRIDAVRALEGRQTP